MKPAIISILFILLQNTALTQSAALYPFTLEGRVDGRDSGYVYLNYFPNGGRAVMDSCVVKNGCFRFKSQIAETTRATFSTFNAFNPGIVDDEKNRIEFYIEPVAMTLHAVYNQFKDARLSGSATDSERVKLAKLIMPIDSVVLVNVYTCNEYRKTYWKEKESGSDTVKLRFIQRQIDSVENIVLKPLSKKRAIIDSTYIVQNPNSFLAADLLTRRSHEYIAFPSLEHLYDKFPGKIQNTVPGKAIKYKIDQDKRLAIGATAFDFIATDSKGDTIRLNDYKGKKYVLLDFGASWCTPCRYIIPFLKKEYAKYDSGFEIISIADQDEVDDWKKVVKEDALKWPQVVENKKLLPVKPADSTIMALYYIDTFPSLVLIGKDSKIIGKYGGFYYSSGSHFTQDLEEQLK